jgi:hypothetical protein
MCVNSWDDHLHALGRVTSYGVTDQCFAWSIGLVTKRLPSPLERSLLPASKAIHRHAPAVPSSIRQLSAKMRDDRC